MGSQSGEQAVRSVLLEVVTVGSDPSLDLLGTVSDEGPCHPPEIFQGVPEIDSLDCARSAIVEVQATTGERQSPPPGLPTHAPDERRQRRVGVKTGCSATLVNTVILR